MARRVQGGRWRKEIEWRERLARFARAGTSIAQFCEDEGVSTPAFYAWRKRLAGGAAVLPSADARAGGQRQRLFAPLRVTTTVQTGSQVTVWLRGGTRLDIPLADPSVAATVLGALLDADAEKAGGRPC
jgi:hypothetical protein